MKNEIIKSDTRLLLFRSLEYGIKANLMDDTFLYRYKKEGADMSYAFAKRYYNVVFEAYLRQASHCVLGIMNIGLIESSRNQIIKAADLILERGFVGIFREGWSRIVNLVQYAKSADELNQKTTYEWEKDFSDSFSAEPGKNWIGYDEYRYHMLLYRRKVRG